MPECAICHREVDIIDRVFRREECPHCGADLHTCIQCKFYAPGHHNDCREPQAEFVSDKERANFCDYFVFGPNSDLHLVEDAKAKLEKLFKI